MRIRSVLWLLWAVSAYADTMKMKDGSVVSGNWLGSDAQQVRFATGEQVRSYALRDVQSVTFGDGTTAPTAPPTARPRPQAAFQEEVEGFTFRLDRCEKRGGASVTCFFTAVNHKADRILVLFGDRYGAPSQIIDSNGILQNAKTAQIGSSRGGELTRTELVAEVPVR